MCENIKERISYIAFMYVVKSFRKLFAFHAARLP